MRASDGSAPALLPAGDFACGLPVVLEMTNNRMKVFVRSDRLGNYMREFKCCGRRAARGRKGKQEISEGFSIMLLEGLFGAGKLGATLVRVGAVTARGFVVG